MEKYMKAIEEARQRIERSRQIIEDVNRQLGDELSHEDLMKLYLKTYDICTGIQIVAIFDPEIGLEFDEILDACRAIYEPLYDEANKFIDKLLKEVQHEAQDQK